MTGRPDILVYGGVFDPVHRGHRAVIEAVRKAFPDTRLMVEVTISPPHGKEPVAPAATRIAWVEKSIPGVEIMNPILQQDPQYMIDTVTTLVGMSPAIETVGIVIGQDQWAALASWKAIDELAGHAIFVVVTRPGGAGVGTGDMPSVESIMVDMDPVDVASSDIREAARHQDLETVQSAVDPRIAGQVMATYR